MMTYFKEWLTRGNEERTLFIKYTELNGIFYFLTGLFIFFFPGVPSTLGLMPEVTLKEEGFLQLIGFSLSIVGYFYYFGARTHKKSFGLATVFDRLILVPIFLGIILVKGNLDKEFFLPLLILDPILGIGAYYLWSKESTQKTD